VTASGSAGKSHGCATVMESASANARANQNENGNGKESEKEISTSMGYARGCERSETARPNANENGSSQMPCGAKTRIISWEI
jgi:hypothetical protein